MNDDTKIRNLKKLLSDILSLCVKYPQDIKFEVTFQIDTYKMVVKCHRADKGLLVGVNAANFFGLRDLIASWAIQQQLKIELATIGISREGEKEYNDPASRQPASKEGVRKILAQVFAECLRFPDAGEFTVTEDGCVQKVSVRVSYSERHSRYKQVDNFFRQYVPIIAKANRMLMEVSTAMDMPDADRATQPTENVGRYSR